MVLSDVGFGEINAIVFEMIRDWITETTTLALKNEVDNDIMEMRLMWGLSDIYRQQGLSDKAIPLTEEYLEKSRKILGQDHPQTLESASNLALLYASIEQYHSAESLYEECLQTKKRILGQDHPETLEAEKSLAVLYLYMDQYEKAEILYEDCLQKSKQLLGQDHPDVLASERNLRLLRQEAEQNSPPRRAPPRKFLFYP
jgi:tetratricopeptide (TPR) repeat protein